MSCRRHRIALFILVTVLGGCAGHAKVTPILHGFFATEGADISAEDGSFTLKGGSGFASPFQVNYFEWSSQTENDLVLARDNIRDQHRVALAMGARRVRVAVPGLSSPLYGILLLNMTAETCTGPAARSYGIDIPKQYIEGARGGRVSVVYEEMPCFFAFSGIWHAGIKDKWYSWILWLSDMPIR